MARGCLGFGVWGTSTDFRSGFHRNASDHRQLGGVEAWKRWKSLAAHYAMDRT